MNKKKYCLVTGGAGFIGGHIVETLLHQGYRVRSLDLQPLTETQAKKLQPFLADQLDVVQGDLRDPRVCEDVTKSIDYIFHQAAAISVPESIQKPEFYVENNVMGTLNLFRAAVKNKCKRVIQASSAAVYGATEVLPTTERQPLAPQSPYAICKCSCEHYGKMFSAEYGLSVVSLRYFNVFGPRQNPHSQYAAAIPSFIQTILENQSPIVFGDGEQTRDFIYIDDVVNANIKACFNDKSEIPSIINVGSGTQTSINALIQKITSLCKRDVTINYAEQRSGDLKHSVADIELAKTFLGYNNTVSIDDALVRTITFYKDQSSLLGN